MQSWKRIVASGLLATALAIPAQATWSIVIVNTRTGEVAIGCASCVGSADLLTLVPALAVGKGGVVIQAAGDFFGSGRALAFSELMADFTAQQILDDWLATAFSTPIKQFGVATLLGDSASFTGNLCSAAAGGVVGTVGEISYAVQGNILVGQEVWIEAANTLLATRGDVSQKLMAAMETARALGGDGRCSCAPSMPTGCGVPPPDFTRSADSGFVVLARIGDVDGVCDTTVGCASGSYYLSLNVLGNGVDDPVIRLQGLYDSWRSGLSGRPDGVLSSVTLDRDSLPADGRTVAMATVCLVDVEGVSLRRGGAALQVLPAPGSVSDAVSGAVIDHGDGSYSFPITAGLSSGTASFQVSADDGVTKATLYPYFDVRIDALAGLHCGIDLVSATEGARVPLVVNEILAPGAFYMIVASVSGTSPGTMLGDILVPLNFDEVTSRTFLHSNNPLLPGTRGFLDDSGHAEGALAAPPGLLGQVIGLRMDWSALTFDGHDLRATNPAGFVIEHGP